MQTEKAILQTTKGLHHSDHAETVKIVYDASVVSLQELLAHYFRIIDPTSLNKQGNDAGRQYRTGIYYVDDSMIKEINSFVKFMQKKYSSPIVVEVENLSILSLPKTIIKTIFKKSGRILPHRLNPCFKTSL